MVKAALNHHAPRHIAKAPPLDDPPILALVHRHASRAQPLSHGINPVGFLDPQLLDAPHLGLALGEGSDDRQDGIFVDHARRPLGRHRDPLQIGRVTRPQIGHRLAAFFAQVLIGQIRPHLAQRGEQARARGVEAYIRHQNVRPFGDDRRTNRESRRRRIARHDDILRLELGLAGQGNHPPLRRLLNRDLRAKAHEHPLGMVARRFLLDHHRLARRIQPRQQHRRFHLRRRHRHRVGYRHRIFRPNNGHRQAPARPAIGPRPEKRQGIGHSPHGARTERGIARKGRGNERGRHRPHDEAHARAGIAAINNLRRLGKPANSHAMHAPLAAAQILDLGPESPHRLGGVDHVLALEKPRNPRFADAQGAQDQRAMGNRLVPRHIRHALQHSTFTGRHRNRSAVARHIHLCKVSQPLSPAAQEGPSPCFFWPANTPAGGAGLPRKPDHPSQGLRKVR